MWPLKWGSNFAMLNNTYLVHSCPSLSIRDLCTQCQHSLSHSTTTTVTTAGYNTHRVRQTDRQTDRETDRQTDRQTDRHTQFTANEGIHARTTSYKQIALCVTLYRELSYIDFCIMYIKYRLTVSCLRRSLETTGSGLYKTSQSHLVASLDLFSSLTTSSCRFKPVISLHLDWYSRTRRLQVTWHRSEITWLAHDIPGCSLPFFVQCWL